MKHFLDSPAWSGCRAGQWWLPGLLLRCRASRRRSPCWLRQGPWYENKVCKENPLKVNNVSWLNTWVLCTPQWLRRAPEAASRPPRADPCSASRQTACGHLSARPPPPLACSGRPSAGSSRTEKEILASLRSFIYYLSRSYIFPLQMSYLQSVQDGGLKKHPGI